MKKDKIIQVLNSFTDSIDKDNIELYKSLIEIKSFESIKDVDSFYMNLMYPHEKFISGLIKSEISKNNDVRFILQNSTYINENFKYWILKYEGTACSSDKTRTILEKLLEFYKNETPIKFDYEQEYTFHLPEKIFKTHESIIEFYLGIRAMFYGNPTLYFSALKNIITNNLEDGK